MNVPTAPLVYFLAISRAHRPVRGDRDVPRSSGETGDTVVLRDLAFVDLDLGKVAGLLVPFHSRGTEGIVVDVSTKVSRQITDVRSLLDDWAVRERLVPPVKLDAGRVGHDPPGKGSHNGEVVLLDDLLDLPGGLEVSENITDGNGAFVVLFQVLSHCVGFRYRALPWRASGHGFLQEDGSVGVELGELQLEVAARCRASAEEGRCGYENGSGVNIDQA